LDWGFGFIKNQKNIIMILPNNGTVIIIDDQPEDVKELIAALSKEKIPFVHYKEEDLSDLPETPIENVRLIFLDLELVTDSYIGSKNITAPIKTRLIKILKPQTPYALVIWSKKESEYKKAILKDFENEFSAYKPIFCTSLPKSDIIGKKGAINRIKNELETEIKRFKSFNAFLIWESIVNESAGKLTNGVTTLYPPDQNWDNKTRFLLYKLAEAYSGKAIKGFSDIKQLKNALYTLTLSFTENIENLIDQRIDDLFKDLISDKEQDVDNFTTVINKLLLISDGSDDISQPGNLFFPREESSLRHQNNEKKFVEGKEAITRIPSEKQKFAMEGLEKNYRSERQNIEEFISETNKVTNEIVVSGLHETVYKDEKLKNEILDTVIPIKLNITPLCDYAQEKAKLFRILPGVLIKSSYRNNLNLSSAYLYSSDANFRIEGIDYMFLYDFRFLYSLNKKKMNGYIVKYRLKQQLLSDIQVKLGAHVNRSGVLYIS
jgi:hypothetical protein